MNKKITDLFKRNLRKEINKDFLPLTLFSKSYKYLEKLDKSLISSISDIQESSVNCKNDIIDHYAKYLISLSINHVKTLLLAIRNRTLGMEFFISFEEINRDFSTFLKFITDENDPNIPDKNLERFRNDITGLKIILNCLNDLLNTNRKIKINYSELYIKEVLIMIHIMKFQSYKIDVNKERILNLFNNNILENYNLIESVPDRIINEFNSKYSCLISLRALSDIINRHPLDEFDNQIDWEGYFTDMKDLEDNYNHYTYIVDFLDTFNKVISIDMD